MLRRSGLAMIVLRSSRPAAGKIEFSTKTASLRMLAAQLGSIAFTTVQTRPDGMGRTDIGDEACRVGLG